MCIVQDTSSPQEGGEGFLSLEDGGVGQVSAVLTQVAGEQDLGPRKGRGGLCFGRLGRAGIRSVSPSVLDLGGQGARPGVGLQGEARLVRQQVAGEHNLGPRLGRGDLPGETGAGWDPRPLGAEAGRGGSRGPPDLVGGHLWGWGPVLWKGKLKQRLERRKITSKNDYEKVVELHNKVKTKLEETDTNDNVEEEISAG